MLASGLALPDLSAAAAQSPRPAACRKVTRGTALWETARQPKMVAHCKALARGYSELELAPARALLAAESADRVAPGKAAPMVLAGRALAALGKYEDAYKRFDKALAIDKSAVEEPEALLAYARSAMRAGKQSQAARAYSALASRIALLSTPWLRQRAAIETGLSAMDDGKLPQAIGVLSEARRRENMPGLGGLVQATLALALDRQGRSEQARGVAREVEGVQALWDLAEAPPASWPAYAPIVPPGQLWAVVALVIEREDRGQAKDAWKRFLDSPAGRGPHRAHAQAHLDRLSGRGR